MGAIMQNEQQYEQLILQYNQLKNGCDDISRMIDNEDLDNALTMINAREEIYLNCKCIRKFLDLTPVQKKELDVLLDEIRAKELANIKKLEQAMTSVSQELKTAQKNQKIQNVYEGSDGLTGSIVNIEE